MSASHAAHRSSSLPSRPLPSVSLQTPLPPPDDPSRIVFTRQLWQRNMSDGKKGEHVVLDQSQTSTPSHTSLASNIASTRRNSSLTSNRHSPSLSASSKSPNTPEESPSFRPAAKSGTGFVGHEDKAIPGPEISPANTRTTSGESTVPVCICQPEHKPPRPRNAFILYRQHHQSNVVSRYPGLANPDISKIIGEQWQNESTEQKNKWKALAEEEKIRHQHQYPNYRYQPKRSGRNNSTDTASATDKPKCQKCGGRAIHPPAASTALPPTPGTATTPLGRALPVFRELSLASPATQRLGNRLQYPEAGEEMDDIWPLSPDAKRRKFNVDQPAIIHRAMHPQYSGQISAGSIAPGAPYPFARPGPPVQHACIPAVTHVRRESLPSIKGMVSPQGLMPPPPHPSRPGMGYQAHRMSHGHATHDRSLTLPPLQSARSNSTSAAPGTGKSTEQQIDEISFRYKIKVLSQVAPPAPKGKSNPRGPLIALEGDSPAAVMSLVKWLNATLAKDDDLTVSLLPGPEVVDGGDSKETMASYHRLASEWLNKDKQILDILAMDVIEKSGDDTTMTDASSKPTSSPLSVRKLNENYNDSSDDNFSTSNEGPSPHDHRKPTSLSKRPSATDHMDLDNSTRKPKPILLIPNYSLHTCNTYAHNIPIRSTETYAACEHWQWMATLWRGITGPDLTIYVADVASTATGSGVSSVDIEGVEGRVGVGLFVIRRVRDVAGGSGDVAGAGAGEIEASVLRRIGFEISEWVRAFGEGTG